MKEHSKAKGETENVWRIYKNALSGDSSIVPKHEWEVYDADDFMYQRFEGTFSRCEIFMIATVSPPRLN